MSPHRTHVGNLTLQPKDRTKIVGNPLLWCLHQACWFTCALLLQILHDEDVVAEGLIRPYDAGQRAGQEPAPAPDRWRYSAPTEAQMLTHPAEVPLVDHGNFYNEMARCGLEYKSAFKQVDSVATDKSSAAIRSTLLPPLNTLSVVLAKLRTG